MNDIQTKPGKRKVLTLARAPLPETETPPETSYIAREDAFFMVWREGGDMPKRLYRADEIHKACMHAIQLAKLNGGRFHVMRSWRAFDVAEETMP